MPEPSTPPASVTPRPDAPWWRRAIAWLAAAAGRLAVWIWTTLRRGAVAVGTRVRDTERPAWARAGWGVAGVAGAGAVAAVAGFVAVVLYALVLWPFTPSVSDLRNAREIDPGTVVSADGATLTRFSRLNREWTPLAEISPSVVEALVTTEDRRFYTHGGIDLYGWGAVAAGAATGRGLRGASTITQQLARNLFPDDIGNASSATRKIREAITARKIESVYSKDEILELYLNTVPFLYNAWGIEMAARTYFSTDAGSLTTVQAATLVGMLKGTSSYNPYRNPERAKGRRNVVLGQMARFGDLPDGERARLSEQPLGLRFVRQPMQRSRAPHFTEHVRKELEGWADDTGYSLYGDGLTIHTTLDWRMQQRAQESAARFGNALQSVADVEWGRTGTGRLGPTTEPYVTASRRTEPFEQFWSIREAASNAFIRDTRAFSRATGRGRDADAVLDSLRATPAFLDSLRQVKMRLEVAMTAVEPETGHVKVWIGSRDFERSAYDHVARARRQPGSTFKPFLYARALEEGFRPDDLIPDEDIAIEMDDGVVWKPTNASGTSSGEMVTLREGLVYSKNTVAARLVQQVGARDLARTARKLGVESPLATVPSLALGTSDVSLLEMTGAYAAIAAGGIRHPVVTVTHITDRDGNEVARFERDADRVLDPDVATDLVDMMRGVVDEGTGRDVRTRFGARGDLAGKTGTTQDGADGWFLLMHPDLVTGAWVGFDDPRVTFRSAYWGQGGHNALRVVGDFERAVQRDGLLDLGREFPRPDAEADAPGGPSLWSRFAGWVGGVVDGVFRDGDVPENYGPRTPGRRAEPDARDHGGEVIDRRVDRARDRRDVLAGNLDWLRGAWQDVQNIEDPEVRRAASAVLREAAREFERGEAGRGWSDRVDGALDRAVDQAQREAEQAVRDELDNRGFLIDEIVPYDEDSAVSEIEDVPVQPEAPPAPTGREPDPEQLPAGNGRIAW